MLHVVRGFAWSVLSRPGASTTVLDVFGADARESRADNMLWNVSDEMLGHHGMSSARPPALTDDDKNHLLELATRNTIQHPSH